MDRKGFLKKLTLGSGLILAPFVRTESKVLNRALVHRPPMIRPGDTAAIAVI
jgi:hypothetical protein